MRPAARPLRADAARNRARVLEVACEAFATGGWAVSINEIARRAGVGAGTVYRHFPVKEELFRAAVEDRIVRITDEGRDLLAVENGAEALFTYFRSIVLHWGAINRGLAEAVAGLDIDVKASAQAAQEGFIDVLGDLLHGAQKAGTARCDLDAWDLKALMVGTQAMQTYSADAAAERLTEVVLDGLRPPQHRTVGAHVPPSA